MHIFNNILDNKLFNGKNELIQLSFVIKYMGFPEEIHIRPMGIKTIKDEKEITFSVTTNSFIFVNIYKDIITASLSRYYYSKYKISLLFIPVFH
jgi:hypothetical protein